MPTITLRLELHKPTQVAKVMGIDLGLRYFAVAGIGTKSLFFKGS